MKEKLDVFLKKFEPSTPSTPSGEKDLIFLKIQETQKIFFPFSKKIIPALALAASLVILLVFSKAFFSKTPSLETGEYLASLVEASEIYQSLEYTDAGFEYLALAEALYPSSQP